MKETSFWKSKAGGMTLAFLLILLAFALIMMGLHHDIHALTVTGFILIVVAMLYAPLRRYVFKR